MAEMTATEVLQRMIDRFDGGRAWCQGRFRRVSDGRLSWCLIGALNAETQSLNLREEVKERLFRASGCNQTISRWNDEQPHFGTVRAALLAAIEDGK